MTPGLRLASDAAWALDALLTATAVLAPTPEPWRVLMIRAVGEAAASLHQDNEYNARDQSLLSLIMALARTGRHAAWALARVPSDDLTSLNWQAVARWHHDALVVIHAGWIRRLAVGVNRVWPLEANTMEPVPPAVRVSETAARWLELLSRDPLHIPVAQAALALQVIPAGVWIAP